MKVRHLISCLMYLKVLRDTFHQLPRFNSWSQVNLAFLRVTRGRYNPILSPLIRVGERAEVLPEFLETSGDSRHVEFLFLLC